MEVESPIFLFHSFHQEPPGGNETDAGFWILLECLEVDGGDSPSATEDFRVLRLEFTMEGLREGTGAVHCSIGGPSNVKHI